ncbi:MAG: hypothetical protein BroJett011_61320 [Chloroflexota bacterium]|nr:MAG: hypothetical protein BroJett011_61320 [Chloroflexota bacterium]
MRTQPMKTLSMQLAGIYPQHKSSRLLRTFPQVNWRLVFSGVVLLAIYVTLFTAIQFATPNMVDNDGYYHIKLAQLMREEGLRPAFPWLPLSVLNASDFVDHHFLYHVLLIPFTFGDLREGAKWASVIFPAFAFLAGWLLLRGQHIPYAALGSLGFFIVSEAFLYRMSMPRAQAVSLMVLLLALHVTLTQHYRWLLPLAFLYVWFYNAFPLILMVVGVYVAARWLLERQLVLAPLAYAALGLGLGLIINPYFPHNLIFIYHHLFPKLTDATAISVGNEWYPYQTWTLVENSGPALLLFVAGAFALGLREQRLDTKTATVFLLSVLFGLMLFKSRRFVEYFPPFALIFAILAWSPLLRQWQEGKAWRANLSLSLEQAVANLPRLKPGYQWRSGILAGLMLVILLPSAWFTVQATRESMQNAKPYQRYAAASAWLQANTPAGSPVFQTDWDDFPRLFFYNTHNTYTVGLDPTYMQLYDPDLYELWVNITRGRVKAPAQAIAETFGAHYIITDLDHKGFLRQAKADPQLVEVYRDEYAAIFQVQDK